MDDVGFVYTASAAGSKEGRARAHEEGRKEGSGEEGSPPIKARLKTMNPKVNWFFDKDTPWKESYEKLRQIALGCGLTEELKWGHPCYTVNGSNVVLIQGFKEYCALYFLRGVLLEDDAGILIQQTKNMQGARQIRFRGLHEVVKLEPVLKTYIRRAVENEKAGLKVALKKTSEFEVPEEFAARLKASPALKKAFAKLTPGRQRGYLLHFASAKQSKTRIARIDANVDRIMEGLGLQD